MERSHLILFETQRQSIQRHVVEASELCECAPWEIFIILTDLRSEFGREAALHFHPHFTIDAMIRSAETRGEPPGFAVPLDMAGGMEIVEAYTPTLADQVLLRPPQTVAMLIIDEDDNPIIGIGRLFDARVTLS